MVKGNLLNHQEVSKYKHSAKKIFFCFWSLLTVLIVKNCLILAGIYLTFLNTCPRLKGFQYILLTSVKRSGKLLSSKTNFSTFLQISFVKGLLVAKIFQTNQIYRGMRRVRSKNSNVFIKHLRQTLVFIRSSALREKSNFCFFFFFFFFLRFLLVLTKFSFWEEH